MLYNTSPDTPVQKHWHKERIKDLLLRNFIIGIPFSQEPIFNANYFIQNRLRQQKTPLFMSLSKNRRNNAIYFYTYNMS